MRSILLAALSMAGAFLVGLAPAYAQNGAPPNGAPAIWGAAPYGGKERTLDSSQLRVLSAHPIMKELQAIARSSRSFAPAGPVLPALKVFPYTFLSTRDGNTYSGTIVGSSPFNRGARTTTVPVVIIPLRIEFTGTVRNFDPTSPDNGCLGVGNTALSLTEASPIFMPVPNYTMNGVNLGNVTYPDAFQRASFYPQVSAAAPAWHLGFNVSVAAKQTITVVNGGPVGATFTVPGDCSTNTTAMDNPPRLGILDINFVDVQLNNIITSLGLNHSQFPLFLVYGIVMSDGNPQTGPCCILGYHNGSGDITDAGQTYGISEYDQGYIFSGVDNISVLAHEVMEWINDPSTNNLVPPWGNIGQVSGCQDNLEVGDPMSGILEPGVLMPNGVTYFAQEQAFFGWFLGNFAGAGGKYSSNGTFTGFAKPCPPGGTF